MEDPKDVEAIEELAVMTRKRIEPVLGTSQDIQEMIDLNYRVGGEIEEQLSQIPTRYQRARVAEARLSAEAIAQAPVVRAIDLLIKQAVRDRASDVHVEPQEDKLRIRYRIDGILHEVMSLPLSVHPPLLSRVKIMAGLNIAERRRPQDGQSPSPFYP
jgi:type II secretory ATPase GspE/PulE/Tfp pilus assembly ATPase PilB-like protein